MDADSYMKGKYELLSQLEKKEWSLYEKLNNRCMSLSLTTLMIGGGLVFGADGYFSHHMARGLVGASIVTGGFLFLSYQIHSGIKLASIYDKTISERRAFANEIMRELETELKIKEKD